MITKKEDLINTYVDGSNKELSKLYQETAFKFGFDWLHFDDKNVRHDDSSPIICCHEYLKVSWEKRGSDAFSGFKRLTLSDLKPRTKVEYEKVTDSIFDLRDEFERGELVSKVGGQISEIKTESYLVTQYGFGYVHRKVERPVEWWEDAVEYIRSLNGEANAIDFTDSSSDGKKMAMNISVVLDERQAKDFARILLEQEGE